MRPAPEYADLTGPGPWTAYRWEVYDSASRVDLSASALAVDGKIFFVDPVPLAKPALAELLAAHVPAGIVVTNGNHGRAADDFRRRWEVPLWATTVAAAEAGVKPDIVIPPGGGTVCGGVFEAIPVSGGAAGEVALHYPGDGSLLIVGDALINLASHPFSFLPDKYCADPRELRRSLARLLERPFSRLLFAHGEPVLINAHARLAALLGGEGGR